MNSLDIASDLYGFDWVVSLAAAMAMAYLAWLQIRRWMRSDANQPGLGLILALIGLGALVYDLGRYFERPSWSSSVETVFHQTFSREEVQLDNHAFSDCTFDNVTFVYDGNGDFGFANSRFLGQSRVVSRSKAINAAWLFQQQVKGDFGDRSPIIFPSGASQRADR